MNKVQFCPILKKNMIITNEGYWIDLDKIIRFKDVFGYNDKCSVFVDDRIPSRKDFYGFIWGTVNGSVEYCNNQYLKKTENESF